MRITASISILSLALNIHAKQKSIVNKSAVDSTAQVLAAIKKEYLREIDSIHTANYVLGLERTKDLYEGNTNYYSYLFTGIGVAVAILSIIFGFNFFSTRSEFKKTVKEQKQSFAKTVSEQETKFNALIKSYENIINTQSNELNRILKILSEEKLNSDEVKEFQNKIAEMQKQLDHLKRINSLPPIDASIANWIYQREQKEKDNTFRRP